jgi:predicted permease
MLKDLKHAVRVLLQSRGWTAVVLLSLALGIGANTALFTAVNGLMLQTVALPDPESLVRLKWAGENDMVWNTSEYGGNRDYEGKRVTATFSYATFEQLRAANQTLADLAASAPIGSFNVVIDGQAEIASNLAVSGNYFQLLRVPMALGRALQPDDEKPGAPPVAVISHGFWQRRFGSEQNVTGRVVSMNNQPVEIIGVTAVGYGGSQRLGATSPDVTVALVHDPLFNVGQARMTQPTTWWLQLMGRIKPGVSYEQVRANLGGVFQEAARAGRASYIAALTEEERNLSRNRRETANVPELVVESGSRGTYDLDTQSVDSAQLLAVVVLLVLLIVCANVANLLLSRATARRKEVSVRISLGATRRRLVRQLLTESLLLSAIGGAIGVLVGYWSRQLLPFGQTTPIDWRVFAFAAGVSAIAGILFGLAPALRATRVDLALVMKETSRSVTGGRNLLGKILLVTQVALSLVLVIGAGLFLRTLNNLRSVDVGFNAQNLLMFSINPALNRYDADRSAVLYRELQTALAAVPGVRNVAITRVALLSGSRSTSSYHVQGGKPGPTNVHMMSVTPEFFETMQIPVVLGRGFTDRDDRAAPKVAIVNETAARALFPDGATLGRRIGGSVENNGEFEVVGVIRDTRYSSLREPAPPTLYQAMWQQPARAVTVMLRTATDPSSLVETVRAAVRKVDTNLPITNVATQMEQLDRRVAQDRLYANAFSLFGALALVLASIGLFGVMSYMVARRTNEIGVRMALGANRLDVARMVLRETLVLVGAGVAVGLGAALLAGRYVAEKLYAVPPRDVATMSTAVAVIVGVGLLAGFLPARRASRVDPMVALRME